MQSLLLRSVAHGCRPLALPAVYRPLCVRSAHSAANDTVHFRESRTPHPLKAKPWEQAAFVKREYNDRYATTANHIWSKEEIDHMLANLWQHKPQTFSDKFVHGAMYGLYKTFNFITGYKAENTPVRAVEWRLIVLESFAGVPGFVAAMFRHFRSLRNLCRDHGWIHTLLEEAENERMHLLTCMKMFDAGIVTRTLVISAQVVMTPFVAALLIVKPGAAHRFVGYLEETACITYANVIHQVETPGTPLHGAWSDVDAPEIARTYWKLSDDAKWVDVLKCMFADECNHRDVNHTFATMSSDDPNPFVYKHQADALKAWRLEAEGSTTNLGCEKTLGVKPMSTATA
mmetsp:Transcript_91104/g.208855  ORF Transcript_91104/g.208855 Transcript_91104/m.208855 type:complete len:344 (-) Transcript_91104:423-1454(-)